MKPFNANGAFRPAVNSQVLRSLAVRGAGATVLSQSLGFAVQMIATVILARLLTPRDFGLMTMVTTFSLLLLNCGLNGFTEAVLQREEIDHTLASNLFWINLGLGLLLTVSFAAAGPLLARFFGDSRVTRVAVVMSTTIFFTTVSVQHLALLKRAMRFSLVSCNDIIARAVSATVSIILAWAGWGYWALVAGAVALSLATSIGAWAFCRWVPGLPRRGAGTGPMVRFAMSTYGRFTSNYFSRNLDNLLIGWRLGSEPLGFYKKAYDLFVLPANQLSAPLTSVAVSALSRLARDTIQYRRYFLNALSILAFVGMGLGADLTLVGKDLFVLLLGPGWEESGRIFTFFGPGIGVMLLYGTHGWIHLSIGRADRWFRWGLVEFVMTALLFLLGLRWGPVGIAVAWVASFWVLTIPALWYAGRPAALTVASIIAAVWRYVLASALAGCATATITWRITSFAAASGPAGAGARIVMISSVFGGLYVGGVILLHCGCAPLCQVARLLRDMLPSVRSAPGCRGGLSHERGVHPNQGTGNELVS
ncbi:MAG TPA: lipopolysaccharide biosynthesis protein [Terriglobales bacterium]|nr:lipopolysaccharide biosynthesis protein [Terriglobales bacterium]